MIKRVLLAAVAALGVTALSLLTAGEPAHACLLPCLVKEPSGTILGGGMPDILLGLFLGVLLAILASFVAYRSGVRDGLRRSAPELTSDRPEDLYR